MLIEESTRTYKFAVVLTFDEKTVDRLRCILTHLGRRQAILALRQHSPALSLQDAFTIIKSLEGEHS